MKHMNILIIVIAILIIGGLVAWRWLDNNSIVAPVNKTPEINKICNSLPIKETASYSHFEIATYSNDNGEVGGFMAYDPEMDGGVSQYFDSQGNLIGSWGLVRTPDQAMQADAWNDIRTSHPIKTVYTCNK